MIEYLVLPALAIGAALVPKRKTKDIDKIKKIFENTGLGIKKGDEIHYPILLRQTHQASHSTYVFSLPLGLPSEKFESLLPAIEEGLNKECSSEFEDGVFKLRTYNEKLPTSWKFDESLLNPNTWMIPIGKNHDGILYHDFDKYPHMLVGGVTRFGKTVFIKEAFYSLLMNQMNNAEFYFLDLKGGLEFGKYIGLPQVKAVASDIYESAEVLGEIVQDLNNSKQLYRQKGYTNIVDTPIKTRKFIIVDEGAELAPAMMKVKEMKKYAEFCQAALSEIARIGGGLGYRLMFCTQYPVKEAVPMQVKMNIVARLSFIASAQVASRVILDENGAEDLPGIPGRAIYKIEKNRIVQVPYIDDKYMFEQMGARENDIIQCSQDGSGPDDHRPVGDGNRKTSSWNP